MRRIGGARLSRPEADQGPTMKPKGSMLGGLYHLELANQ